MSRAFTGTPSRLTGGKQPHIFVLLQDEQLQRRLLDSLSGICPGAGIVFPNAAALLSKAREEPPGVVFLSEHLRETHGYILGKKLKERFPDCNLIYVCRDGSTAYRLWPLHPSGCLLNDFSDEQVRYELDNLRHPLQE